MVRHFCQYPVWLNENHSFYCTWTLLYDFAKDSQFWSWNVVHMVISYLSPDMMLIYVEEFCKTPQDIHCTLVVLALAVIHSPSAICSNSISHMEATWWAEGKWAGKEQGIKMKCTCPCTLQSKLSWSCSAILLFKTQS